MNKLVPLESNPDVLNKYLQNLGVPDKWKVVDVYGLESELLMMIPQPTLAFLFLYPYSDKYKDYREKIEAEITEKGQTVSKDIFYMKQTVSNACGTIGLIHCVANNLDQIDLADGPLKHFLDESINLSPDERAEKLKSDEVVQVHEDIALEGQTEFSNLEEPVYYHYSALICKDGSLYELDGKKSFPINHGPSSPETFMEDAAAVCKQYMERDPDDVRFTVIALAATE